MATILEAKPLINRLASLTGINIDRDPVLVRDTTAPFQKHTSGPHTSVIGVSREHIEIYPSSEQPTLQSQLVVKSTYNN